jgi:flagellar biosynthesis protein FlhG
VKGIEELDHYEVLEIARDARREDIERAYQLVRVAYTGEALAAYSVFDADEADALRGRIERAYQVLSDPVARRAYDAASQPESSDPSLEELAFSEESPEEFAEAGRHLPVSEVPAARPVEPVVRDFEEPDEDGEAEWDGARLRRVRLLRGVELDSIVAATKINPTYLRFLEEERFDDLPAAVYVRGFVAAYARQLGLDAARVARSYTARLEEHRTARTRGRQPGRR